MHRLTVSIIFSLIAGCAYRSAPPAKQGALEPYVNLYSRNFVVAAPTAVANNVCGVVGGVALTVVTVDGNALVPGAVAGALACGAVVGLPFIPLSYLCEENPWYINQEKETKWSCHPPARSSP